MFSSSKIRPTLLVQLFPTVQVIKHHTPMSQSLTKCTWMNLNQQALISTPTEWKLLWNSNLRPWIPSVISKTPTTITLSELPSAHTTLMKASIKLFRIFESLSRLAISMAKGFKIVRYLVEKYPCPSSKQLPTDSKQQLDSLFSTLPMKLMMDSNSSI